MDVRIQNIPFWVRSVASGRVRRNHWGIMALESQLRNLQGCTGRQKTEKRKSEQKGEESSDRAPNEQRLGTSEGSD